MHEAVLAWSRNHRWQALVLGLRQVRRGRIASLSRQHSTEKAAASRRQDLRQC